MKNKKLLFIIILVLIIFIVITLFNQKKEEENKIDLNSVSNNYKLEDDDIMFLYQRYHPEDNLKFNILGNDNGNNYALYYKNSKITFKEFPNNLKASIILDTINYKNNEYNEEKDCYTYPLDEFKKIYLKNYGSIDDFNLSDIDEIEVNNDTLCIKEQQQDNIYNYTIDTYFVNGIKQGNKITIYERVAFIKIDEDYLYFYKDYKNKNLIYKLKITDETDMSFINNSNIVSNVLLKYQDKFKLYEYNYIKGENTYHLESIKK